MSSSQGRANWRGAGAELLLRWRDGLLASSRFQRWAARFPLTRPLARRRALQLYQLTAGFIYSQVLLACVQLDLFRLLQGGPMSRADIARRVGLGEEGLERLLAAAASLRLLQRRGAGAYGLGDLGAAMLGNPGIAAMVEHHRRLYADLADPVALLEKRGPTRLSDFWPYSLGSVEQSDPVPVAGYSDLMADSQALVSDHILDAYPLRRHSHLLDVAGGSGAFIVRALSRWPALGATLFDLPPVARMAGERFEQSGLSARAVTVGGDMHAGNFPTGADLISLVRVLHDHDDEPALRLLRAAHRALPAGGSLLIAEPMAGTPGAEPVGDAYFGMYLWAMGSGRPRTAGELSDMALRAGFRRCRELRTHMPLLVRVILAEK